MLKQSKASQEGGEYDGTSPVSTDLSSKNCAALLPPDTCIIVFSLRKVNKPKY